MKKLALTLLLLTPAIGVATKQNLDPFPDCMPCGRLVPDSGNQTATAPAELPADAQ